jgi:hypothetical protein
MPSQSNPIPVSAPPVITGESSCCAQNCQVFTLLESSLAQIGAKYGINQGLAHLQAVAVLDFIRRYFLRFWAKSCYEPTANNTKYIRSAEAKTDVQQTTKCENKNKNPLISTVSILACSCFFILFQFFILLFPLCGPVPVLLALLLVASTN